MQLKATADGAGVKLNGKKTYVIDAGVADVIVVVARGEKGLSLVAVPTKTAGVKITPIAPVDQTRKLYDVESNGREAGRRRRAGHRRAASAALARSLEVATVVVAADMLGGMQWILEAAVEYAKTRQQFGKTIGTFQSVQHMCADMLLWTESSRSAIYYAAWALDAEPSDAARAVSLAKAYTSDASREVGNRGVQVHGGIGFTWEHDLQLYYKRSKASEVLFGDSAYHRDLLAALAFDRPSAAIA